VARVPDLHKACVQCRLQHGSWVVGAQFKLGAEPGLLIIWRLIGELDAEMPSAGKLAMSIGWSMPGTPAVRTGLPMTASKLRVSSWRRCGRAKMCTLLPRAIMIGPCLYRICSQAADISPAGTYSHAGCITTSDP
jgi:hypothetical protein